VEDEVEGAQAREQPFKLTKTLAPGHWRAVLKYGGKKGFKRSSSAPVEFDVA
jgi:hypothetical protein